jgi:hypothetical protein
MGGAEAQVVLALKRHLERKGASRIVVDADPAYRKFRHDLEPMARIEIDGARPDLVCSIERTAGVLVEGYEVKASIRDWVPGLAQARRYRAGVHQSYLAIPGRRTDVEAGARTMAREGGVGIIVLEGSSWHEAVAAADPIPLPWTVGATVAALEGVPVARQLQLNHPLNYLVVPYFAATAGAGRLLEVLGERWADLGSPATRRQAIIGAQTLRLIDHELRPTAEGYAVAELLLGLGFTPEGRPSKRARLADVAPAVAAVARFVLLQQPAVQLVLRSLKEEGRPVALPQLARRAIALDPPMGSALFLFDPSAELRTDLEGKAYNPTTVFKLKQNLWHSGLLATGAHSSAGGPANAFRPREDVWKLEARPGWSPAVSAK